MASFCDSSSSRERKRERNVDLNVKSAQQFADFLDLIFAMLRSQMKQQNTNKASVSLLLMVAPCITQSMSLPPLASSSSFSLPVSSTRRLMDDAPKATTNSTSSRSLFIQMNQLLIHNSRKTINRLNRTNIAKTKKNPNQKQPTIFSLCSGKSSHFENAKILQS